MKLGWTGLALLLWSVPALAADPATLKLYETKCLNCHGKDGKGNPAKLETLKLQAADLDVTDETSVKMTDDEWATIVRDGKKKMPKFKEKLNEAEVKALIAYMRSFAAAK